MACSTVLVISRFLRFLLVLNRELWGRLSIFMIMMGGGTRTSVRIHSLILCSITTLGIHVHKEYSQWALKSVNIAYIGPFGSLGPGQVYQVDYRSGEPCWVCYMCRLYPRFSDHCTITVARAFPFTRLTSGSAKKGPAHDSHPVIFVF